VGGTNARFAIRRRSRVTNIVKWPTAEFPSLESAATRYLKDLTGTEAIRHAAIAFAGPVTGPDVRLTNQSWRVNIDRLQRALALDQLVFVNDFAAIALALPVLHGTEREKVGRGRRVPDAPAVVLGPGTGLGTGTVIRVDGGDIPIQGEGGHMPLSATTAREAELLSYLRGETEEVIAEDVLSGPGLLRLYRGLAALNRQPPHANTPAGVTRAARRGRDATAREALQMFAAFLGTVAKALALTCCARGGVYIAGGIVAPWGPLFDRRTFRRRFEGAGAARKLLVGIPTYIITHPWPAFLGLSRLFVDGER
jgi:glucokinase